MGKYDALFQKSVQVALSTTILSRTGLKKLPTKELLDEVSKLARKRYRDNSRGSP